MAYTGKVYNCLVFPGGTESGLEIWAAIRDCKDIRRFSASMDVSSHAPFAFARHFTIPSIHQTGWLQQLNELIVRESIDYIFPAYDDIIVALAENADQIR